MRQRSSFLWLALALVAVVVVILTHKSSPDGDDLVRTGSAESPGYAEGHAAGAAEEGSAPASAESFVGGDARPAKLAGWHPSTAWRGTYALTVHATITQSASLGAGGDVDLRATVSLGAPLDGVPVDGTGAVTGGLDEVWVGGRIGEVVVTGAPALAEQFRMADTRAFAIRVDEFGEPVDERFERGTPEAVRNTLGTIVAALTPDPDSAAEGGAEGVRVWQRGQDGVGVYGAGNALLSRDAQSLVTASYHYRLAADVSLDASVPMRQTVDTTATMTRVGTATGGAIAGAGLLTEDQLSLGTGSGVKPPAIDALPPVAALLAESEAAYEARDDRRRSRAERSLAYAIETSETATDELVAKLREGGFDGNGLRTATAAFTLAKSPRVRALFAALMADVTLPNASRHSLVSAMTFVPEPSEEAVAALMAIVAAPDDGVRHAAALALAALTRGQAERDPELAASLRADLIARATASLTQPGQSDRELWLGALGNLGGADVWPLLEPYVVSRDEAERYLAIESLRFVPTVDARMALAKAMRLDPAFANRRRAVEIAAYQPQAAMLDSVVRALREDADPSVRLGAAHVVAVWAVTTPALVAEVDLAAERETHSDVKQAMQGLHPVDLDAEATP